MEHIISTFYKFVLLQDPDIYREQLLQLCQTQGIRGTILLAHEGINATIAGSSSAIDTVLTHLRQTPAFSDLDTKEATAESPPFGRLKIKVRQEIVTLGCPEVDPSQQVGQYVEPSEWNQVLMDPEVVVIDTRNQYEVDIGSFRGAINPQTDSFRQFPDYARTHLDPTQHKKIAMFCTGGIRCEKATSYLLQRGFQEVYHLKGGILKYLEEVPPGDSLWEGECFVFDQRVAVQHGVDEGHHEICYGCGHPLSSEDLASPHYEVGIACPYCWMSLTPQRRLRRENRQRQRRHNRQQTR